jgi:putative tryptophan/tyrosine transport system substrate-binding protein
MRSALAIRRAAHYADLRNPSNLPVQAPVNFVLKANLKTAKTLGLEVPALLQQRANEVIE